MTGRINQHQFPGGAVLCVHCNANAVEAESRSCVFRDGPPREIPVSVFNDLGTIGDRMKEIRAVEDIGLRGSAL